MGGRILTILTHLAVALLVDHATLWARVRTGDFATLRRLIANRWQLGTGTWLVGGSLAWRRLIGLTVDLGGSGLSTTAFFFLLPLGVFLLLASFPLLADLFELCDKVSHADVRLFDVVR